MPGPPPAASFPSVAHILTASRHQKIQRLAVELIAGRKYSSAVFNRGKIGFRALG